jgi:protein ImuB
MKPARILALICRDWPITAAGYRPEDRVAVIENNKVVACSAGARGAGVQTGIRRREAQNRVPDLEIINNDAAEEARCFEPIAVAVESVATTVEVLRPGVCLLETRGPSRYFGGDFGLVNKINEVTSAITQGLGAICQIGIADGVFAAQLAANQSVIVPAGTTPEFLAALPIDALERPELTSLLKRLGLRTLGDFAALSSTDVMARFGPDGAQAHRLAQGLDEHRLVARPDAEDFSVSVELDPPEDRIDAAAFAGRSLAVQLLESLSAKGLTCSRVTIEAQTEHGESLSRNWRFDGCCSERSLSERVRWQLDGWISGANRNAQPTSGLISLALIPSDVRPNNGDQANFWNLQSPNDERAGRGIARVQALLGPNSVLIPSIVGGRHPSERVRLTPWGEVPEPVGKMLPWPNQLPSPAPTMVMSRPRQVEVLDDDNNPVTINRRSVLSKPPHVVQVDGQSEAIDDFGGPWTTDDQWWDANKRRRGVYVQVTTDVGNAYLLNAISGRWYLSGSYE